MALTESPKNYQACLRRILDSNEHITPIRDQILRIICSTEKHLTSREILDEIHAKNMKVSRTSVFRTLDFFTKLAILRPTYVESQAPSYVLLPEDGHHAHIICPQCNDIEEISYYGYEEVLSDLEKRYKRHFTGHLLECYGLCSKCAD